MDPSERRYMGRRRTHVKSRTGCLTCKIRRVKCDEEKPSCRRCINFGTPCDFNKPSNGSSGANTNTRSRGLAVLQPKSSHVPLLTIPSTSRFQNEGEFRYFDMFSTSTAYEIFPSVEMGKLRLMFLQASESEASILHAIIALGALDKTSQASQHNEHLRSCDIIDTPDQHLYNALREYTKAIHYARNAGDMDLRTALITSLAILAFEAWYGRHDMALQQIKIAIRLLHEWRSRYIDTMFRSGYSTPMPLDVEAVLSPIFTRLSVQLVSSADYYRSLHAAPSPAVMNDRVLMESMPAEFGTLDEAGTFQEALLKRLLAFISKGQSTISQTTDITRAYPAFVYKGSLSPLTVREKELLMQDMNKWISAFLPLKARLQPTTLDDKKAVLALEMVMKAGYISIITVCTNTESIYDEYWDFHNDIVNLSEALLNASQPTSIAKGPRFCFDTGVVIFLFWLGNKCRDPVLRRKAISLLRDFPRQEGLWNSHFAREIIECVMEAEEEFMDEQGYIPEWARIKGVMFTIDVQKHHVKVQFQQRICEASEETVTKKKTVECIVGTADGKPCLEGGRETPAMHFCWLESTSLALPSVKGLGGAI